MIWEMRKSIYNNFSYDIYQGKIFAGSIHMRGNSTGPMAKRNVPKHILDRFINQLERGYDKQTTTTNKRT